MTGCTAGGSAAPSPSESSATASAPGPRASSGDAGGAPDPATGTVALETVADGRHSWITAQATVTGIAARGDCEYTATDGTETITRTSKALPNDGDSVCGSVSLEMAADGTYEVSVVIAGVSDEPLTASTSVEYTAS